MIRNKFLLVFLVGAFLIPHTSLHASTLVVQSLSPSTTVSPGTAVQFDVVVSGITSPTYSMVDSLAGSSLSNGNINSSGHFSWTPVGADAGVHNITITVSDPSGITVSLVQQLTVNAPSVSIQGIYPSSEVMPGQQISLIVAATGFVNPSYSVNDYFKGTDGSTLSSSRINSSGYLAWTPLQAETGIHTVTITVRDGTGRQESVTQTITVLGPSIVVTGLTPGPLYPGSRVSFSANATGFGRQVTYTLKDSFGGSSITNGNISEYGSFNWIPLSSDVGTHTVTASGTDPTGRTNGQTFDIVIRGFGDSTPVIPPRIPTASTTPTLPMQIPTSTNPCPPGQFDTQTGKLCSGLIVSPPKFTTYLALGSNNAEVYELQKFLAAQGYFSGSVTGYYGILTKASVEKFQKARGLAALGVVGPETRTLLNKLTVSITPVSPVATSFQAQGTPEKFKFTHALNLGSTGTDVTELQKRLTTEGFYSGPVNGSYGPLTQSAIKSYQSRHGLQQLGNVGPGTRAALNQ